ncbi:sulfite exporter TauE/SafE family protein [Corticibacter populi]|uniref:Probable membrane transporter protein n=1 Tax=Corticibacter populi TaxID=1550736 RepID=A0A3M6QS88_9BURK|nr:sulfite exporter TauE/SafE family protein [Corticibacter populi]RMX05896.1 sulfite exporter TauE/SafE family protein [Corticibacter populi]RZS30785.1 hypothetical protein EV687_2979 [Corticibacter populi]
MWALLQSWLPGSLGTWSYLGMGLVIAIASCLQGIGGIGFAMFTAPIAGLFFPELVPGPLLVLGCLLSTLSAWREFASVDWKAVGIGTAGRIAGTLLAALLMVLLSPNALSVAFALMILAAVAMSLGGWKIVQDATSLGAAGVMSGIMGTVTSAGAAPFAILMQNQAPARVRATMGCIFSFGAAFSVLILVGIGRFDLHGLALAGLLLPWMLLGFAISSPIGRRLAGKARPLLLGLSAFSAVGILIKVVLT